MSRFHCDFNHFYYYNVILKYHVCGAVHTYKCTDLRSCVLCVHRALMDFTTAMACVILSVSSLHAAYRLFEVNIHSVS